MESLVALWLWDPFRSALASATLVVLFFVPAFVTSALRPRGARQRLPRAGSRSAGRRPVGRRHLIPHPDPFPEGEETPFAPSPPRGFAQKLEPVPTRHSRESGSPARGDTIAPPGYPLSRV